MSLTPEEVAMCVDALLEKGVPSKIVSDLVHFAELGDRVYRVYGERWVSDVGLAETPNMMEYMRSDLYTEMARRLVDEGIGTISEARDPARQGVRVTLAMSVVAPPEWTPPAKVQR